MRFKVGKKVLRAIQYSIDVALWILVENVEEDFDHKRSTFGYMLTYVDDFLMVGPDDVRNAIEEEISKIWKYKMGFTVKQFDKKNLGASLTFLSTIIRSHPKYGGYTMSQELFIIDTLKQWDMLNSRPAVTPGEVTTAPLLEEENRAGSKLRFHISK